MKAIVYVRQSQDRHGTELAISRQREDCERLCRDRGWSVAEVLADNDVSATSRKPRPGFDRVKQAIAKRQADVVVCWHVDRLVRHLADLEQVISLCEQYAVKLATVSGDLDLSTDAGRLVGRILASVARGEVERKSARQRRAQEQAAKKGLRIGGRRPFGYENDGVTIKLDEAGAVRDGYRWLLAGVPLGEIARRWNARGLTTGQVGHKTGNPGVWRRDNVRQVLINPRYAGLRRYRGEEIGAAVWPALVAEDTFRAAQATLADPSRRTAPIVPGRALLTNLAGCGWPGCSANVHGGRAKGNRTYRCRDNLGHISRKAEPVEDFISALVVERLSRPDARELLIRDDRPDIDKLRAEELALRQRLESLAVDFAEGDLTVGQLRTATQRVREKLSGIEAQLADAGRVDVLGPLVQASDADEVWQGMETPECRAVVSVLFDGITLLPVGRGTRTFRPETVRFRWRGSGRWLP